MTETNQPYNPFTYSFSFSQLGNYLPIISFNYLYLALSFLSDDKDKMPYEPTRVLLLKKVPYNATELDIIVFCKQFGEIEDLCIIKTKGYAFVQFKVAHIQRAFSKVK